MTDFFKPSDFSNHVGSHLIAMQANEKLKKLIDKARTVYALNLEDCLHSTWSTSSMGNYNKQAKLMFIEEIVKEPKKEIYVEIGKLNGEPIYKRVLE